MTEQEWREKVMEQVAEMNTRHALTEQHLSNIDKRLADHPPIRHVDKDGVCDAYQTVKGHDVRMNQWIGFTAALSLAFSVIGAAIMWAISWMGGK